MKNIEESSSRACSSRGHSPCAYGLKTLHRSLFRAASSGNQLTMTDAEGHVVHYEYDARGNKSRQYETVTYGEGQTAILTTLYEYDDAGRLVKSTQPDGRYTQTIYNSIGKAWKTRDLDGRWTEYFYSDRGEQVGVLYWDNTTEATAYTETGKQDTHTDREGIVTKYEYDAKGRQSKVYRFYGTYIYGSPSECVGNIVHEQSAFL